MSVPTSISSTRSGAGALAAYTEAAVRWCFDAEPDPNDAQVLTQHLSGESDRHLGHDRWLVYRSMVRHRLRGVIQSALPRTVAVLGEDFDFAFAHWLQADGPRTRFFRGVPEGFADSLSSRPQFVSELARYEIARWNARQAAEDAAASSVNFERRLLLSASVTLLRLGFDVSRRGHERDVREHCLLVYRSSDFRAVTMELNSLAADLMEAWLDSACGTLADSVTAVTTKRGTAIDARFVEGLSALLEDFIVRGVVVGCV